MKGYELIKNIHDGIIDNCKIKWDSPKGNGIIEVKHRKIIWEEGSFSTLELTSSFTNFQIIEEQQNLDIQIIEEKPKILFLGTEKKDLMKVLNDIIDNQNLQLQAVKQLDKKIKEK